MIYTSLFQYPFFIILDAEMDIHLDFQKDNQKNDQVVVKQK